MNADAMDRDSWIEEALDRARSGAGGGWQPARDYLGEARASSAPATCSQECSQPRPEFLCPITRAVMGDPVILETGHTYEREAIIDWINKGYDVCPQSGHHFDTWAELVPNYNLRDAINSWRLSSASDGHICRPLSEATGALRPVARTGRSRTTSYAPFWDYHEHDSSCSGSYMGPSPRRLYFPESEVGDSPGKAKDGVPSEMSKAEGVFRTPSPRGPPTPGRVAEAPLRPSPRSSQSPRKEYGGAQRGRNISVSSAGGTPLVPSYFEYFSRRRASMATYLSYVAEVESRWRSQLPYWTDSPIDGDTEREEFSFPFVSPESHVHRHQRSPRSETVSPRPMPPSTSRHVGSGPPRLQVTPEPERTWSSWSSQQLSPSSSIGSPTQAALSQDLPRLLDTIASTSSVETRVTSLRALARMCQPPGWHASEVERELSGGQSPHLWCSRGEHLAQIGGMDVLGSFLHPGSQQPDSVKLAACWAIRAAAAASDRAAAAGLSIGVVELLLGIISDSRNADLLEAAAWTLFEVSAGSDYVLTSAINTGVLAALVGLLEQALDHPGVPAYQQAAAAACWLLYGLGVAGEETGITLGVEASTEPAVALLQTKPAHELCSAVVALLSILADSCDANSVRIVRANAMPALLCLVDCGSKGDLSLAERAAAVMCKLIAGEGGRRHAVQAGGVPVFLRLLRVAPRCAAGWQGLAEMTHISTGTRELLSVEGAVAFVVAQARQLGARERSASSPGVPQASTELSSLTVQVLRHASEEEQGVAQLLACGAIGVLLELLYGSWRSCAELSARTLWNLVHDDGKAGSGGGGRGGAEAALAGCPGAIPALLHAAQVGAALGRECAAETARLLCSRYPHLQDQMWEAGGVPIMCSIIDSRFSPKLVESASRSLQLLAGNSLARADVAALGCEDALHSCLTACRDVPSLHQILHDTIQAVDEAKRHCRRPSRGHRRHCSNGRNQAVAA